MPRPIKGKEGAGFPSPAELAPRDYVKVTIVLSRRSVDFFKAQACENHTKYQRMIRELVDRYAAHYQPKP